jgi:hypothetical protein
LDRGVKEGIVEQCKELVGFSDGLYSRPIRCNRSTEEVRLTCPADRGEIVACYCNDHGGIDRARSEVLLDWRYRAPASVGNAAQVMAVGCMGLTTEHSHLVVRKDADEVRPDLYRLSWSPEVRSIFREVCKADPKIRQWTNQTWHRTIPDVQGCVNRVRWYMIEADDPRVTEVIAGATSKLIPGTILQRKRPWLAYLGLGSYSDPIGAFESREKAIKIGTEIWREKLTARVDLIREKRGGTLDWGIPVEPRSDPILIEPLPGENSWDAAIRLERGEEAG